MSVRGFVVVHRTIPVGDKVALRETVSRVMSASLTTRKVFGGGEARRKLARRASLRAHAIWGLLLVILSSLVAMSAKTRRSLSALAPPQDIKDCHVGGNAFVPFDGFEPVTLCNICSQKAMKSLLLWHGLLFCSITWGFVPRICEVLSEVAHQRTRGCSPRGLGGVETLVQGL